MKERGILFSGTMARAILSGAKTVTRRVSKEAPSWATFADTRDNKGIVDWHSADVKPNGAGSFYSSQWAFSVCPYGAPGDRLWVRETWAAVPRLSGGDRYVGDEAIRYRATWDKAHSSHWRPSIFMQRAASRITLEVVKVSVERLQYIDDAEALREGVNTGSPRNSGGRGEFMLLWEKINGRGSWDRNPWVWRVEFRRVEGGSK